MRALRHGLPLFWQIATFQGEKAPCFCDYAPFHEQNCRNPLKKRLFAWIRDVFDGAFGRDMRNGRTEGGRCSVSPSAVRAGGECYSCEQTGASGISMPRA